MEKEFVPYELAVKLKELDFDEECVSFYNQSRNLVLPIRLDMSDWVIRNSNSRMVRFKCIAAPTWSQAFGWFREKYAYFTSFDYQHNENNGFFYCIINIEDEEFYFPEDFEPNIYKTYEEARQACLEKLIELCQQN